MNRGKEKEKKQRKCWEEIALVNRQKHCPQKKEGRENEFALGRERDKDIHATHREVLMS